MFGLDVHNRVTIISSYRGSFHLYDRFLVNVLVAKEVKSNAIVFVWVLIALWSLSVVSIIHDLKMGVCFIFSIRIDQVNRLVWILQWAIGK